MSLKDGTKKMSKSDFQDASRINILDDPELIIDKILKAKTDSISKVNEIIRADIIMMNRLSLTIIDLK